MENSQDPTTIGHAGDNPYASPQTTEIASGYADQPLNPWLSIWTRPRATIRQIVDTDPTQHVLLLAALAGVTEALDRASMRNAGDQLPLAAILGIAAVFGPLGGLLSLYLGGWALRWTGAQLGGVATGQQVRAALAWGHVPSLMAGVLTLMQIGLVGNELFRTDTPLLESSPPLALILMVTGLVQVAAAIWSFVVMLKCLGEVHRFSAWRAFGAVLLVGFIVIGLVLCIAVVVVTLSLAARAL